MRGRMPASTTGCTKPLPGRAPLGERREGLDPSVRPFVPLSRCVPPRDPPQMDPPDRPLLRGPPRDEQPATLPTRLNKR